MGKIDPSTLGFQISEARKEKKLTQKELGLASIGDANICWHWEHNKISISDEVLAKIAGVLNKPISYFDGIRLQTKTRAEYKKDKLKHEIVKRVFDYLNVNGKKQTLLADALGVSPQHLSSIGLHGRGFSEDDYPALQAFCNFTLHYLIYGTEDPTVLQLRRQVKDLMEREKSQAVQNQLNIQEIKRLQKFIEEHGITEGVNSDKN